jgi:hypothetical protein
MQFLRGGTKFGKSAAKRFIRMDSPRNTKSKTWLIRSQESVCLANQLLSRKNRVIKTTITAIMELGLEEISLAA